MKRILFITGTRADYGKIKTLMQKVQESRDFELNIFVTGMHMLSLYGSTWKELEKDGFINTYHYINQSKNSAMDIALSNTILGLSNYINENPPDMIVIHGDRLEALAGAIVGAFNNIKVVHIEGGEISGTIDESIRHAITKFSHIHLVSTEEAQSRIVQLGERKENIFLIGSPDIDIMLSNDLPTIQEVQRYYEIPFLSYGILMYHPVTTEIDEISENISNVISALIDSKKNYIVIFPNNDEGSDKILEAYGILENHPRFKIFPSMRFEYFLTLLKHADFMIGNSSAGIRETGIYGIPAVDLGNRQIGRYNPSQLSNISHTKENRDAILKIINNMKKNSKEISLYGEGKSADKFLEILVNSEIWDLKIQKKFVDTEN